MWQQPGKFFEAINRHPEFIQLAAELQLRLGLASQSIQGGPLVIGECPRRAVDHANRAERVTISRQ